MRANMIKVPCLLLAFFRRYLRGYRGKNKFGLASSKLSVSRDKRKKMWTHTQKNAWALRRWNLLSARSNPPSLSLFSSSLFFPLVPTKWETRSGYVYLSPQVFGHYLWKEVEYSLSLIWLHFFLSYLKWAYFSCGSTTTARRVLAVVKNFTKSTVHSWQSYSRRVFSANIVKIKARKGKFTVVLSGWNRNIVANWKKGTKWMLVNCNAATD